jgi:hypothetical protein
LPQRAPCKKSGAANIAVTMKKFKTQRRRCSDAAARQIYRSSRLERKNIGV